MSLGLNEATGMWQSQVSLSGARAGFGGLGTNEEMKKETLSEDIFNKLLSEGG